MRYPIYSHTVNPNIEKPFLRKSLAYCEDLIARGWANWVDANNKRAGVKLRAKVLSRDQDFDANLNRISGSEFNSAWHISQSGYAGPFCWQLKT